MGTYLLRISGFVEDGELYIRHNGKSILNGFGQAEVMINSAVPHELAWDVKGKPQTSFRITLSSPSKAAFSLSKMLGSTGADSGIHLIEI